MSGVTLTLAPYVAGGLTVGGFGAALSRRRELVARWCTWAVTAPLVGGAFLLGRGAVAALAAAAGVIAAGEYARLARLPVPDRLVVSAAALAAPVLALADPAWLGRLALLVPLVAIAPALFTSDVADGGRGARTAFGMVWLGALSQLVALGPVALVLFAAVSVEDVAAWCGGHALGGPRLSPLSPGKTWSGALVGAAAGLGVLALAGALTPAYALAVTVGAPLGDLVESALKRAAGVKDAGAWLPGFGGLLDRIDSLLVALALAGVLR